VPCSRETLQEPGKDFDEMDWAFLCMHTDFRFVAQNAKDSICRKNICDSIETDERHLQQRKHSEPTISTVRRITMEVREELENA
jgi:hypothetical protein